MPTIADSGTQAATINTPHTLATKTTAGTYVLVVNTSALVAGDVVELRLSIKTLSGSTSGLAYQATYAHGQSDPVKVSVPVPVTHEIEATLKQVAGTGKSFEWELLTL